jgi:shikimate dehydrogenase
VKKNVVVNATSIGFFPDITARPGIDCDTIEGKMSVCDVVPNPPRTPFLREAEKRGAKTLSGQGMVVHRGAIGFKLRTGRDAPLEAMKKALADARESSG